MILDSHALLVTGGQPASAHERTNMFNAQCSGAKSHTFTTPNGVKIRTRKSTAYILVAYWSDSLGTQKACIVCGSASLDKLRRRRGFQEYIIHLATGEVIR
jgi:hypothetical protein